MDIKTHIEELTKSLMDKGLIVEAGWVGFKLMTLPAGCHPQQVEDMRNTFFAGAMHVFSSMVSSLEQELTPEVEDKEAQRMQNLNDELDKFGKDFCKKYGLDQFMKKTH